MIPRAAIGSEELIRELSVREDLQIEDVPIYETNYLMPKVLEEEKLFEDGAVTLAVFTSASTVRGFLAAVPEMDVRRVTAVCIGPQTAAEAEAAGMQTVTAPKATMECLAACVEQVYLAQVQDNAGN